MQYLVRFPNPLTLGSESENLTMQYHGIPCNTMEYHAIPWNAIQYHTISCNMAERHTRLLEQTYFTYYGGFPITNIDQKSHEYENWKLKSFWLPMSWSSLQFQYEAEYFLLDPISSPHLHLRCPLNREFSSNWCLSQCEWFHIIEFPHVHIQMGFFSFQLFQALKIHILGFGFQTSGEYQASKSLNFREP